MIQSINNQFPLLVTDEKDAMLSSIVNMLRQKGFIVVRQEQTLQALEAQTETLNLDGLNLLRFVTQNWNQEVPVVITSEIVEQNSLQKSVAA
ncbi:MAG: hypothetical protein AB8H47_29050 [Bacteroidia bacterium]